VIQAAIQMPDKVSDRAAADKMKEAENMLLRYLPIQPKYGKARYKR